jgi:2-C-methyl-D-erythritol 4-phosphate cytidylyltransferase
VGGKPLLALAIERFQSHQGIDDILLVTTPHPPFYRQTLELVRKYNFYKVWKIVEGGETRQESSYRGLMAAGEGEYENVLIHDAARPFVSRQIIDGVLARLRDFAAVTAAVPVTDTIVQTDQHELIRHIPRRSDLKRVQTPQAFRLKLIQEAHQMAQERRVADATDDCSLVFQFKLADIAVVEGSILNIKITHPLDLKVAEEIWKLQKKEG